LNESDKNYIKYTMTGAYDLNLLKKPFYYLSIDSITSVVIYNDSKLNIDLQLSK
jgi:hypothetical protein